MALVSHAGGAVIGAVGVVVLANVIENTWRGDDTRDDRTALTYGGVTRQVTRTSCMTSVVGKRGRSTVARSSMKASTVTTGREGLSLPRIWWVQRSSTRPARLRPVTSARSKIL
jgi:hypothetical protein